MPFTLLRDYLGQPVNGWLMSEKLDGWRVLWTGADFILRGGGVLSVPDAWKVGMPPCSLDGELYAGAGQFNRMQRLIADGFHGLRFAVFDAPADLPFSARLRCLRSLAMPSHCEIVKQIRCRDTAHLVEFADAIVAGGGEGAVVRDPRGIYVPGRSHDVLRWVPQDPRVNRLAA